MTMIMVNVHEAKAKLSEFLDAVSNGETVIICNRNRPVAELRAIAQRRTEPRPIGGTAGVVVPRSFFEPLPDDVLGAFYGEGEPRKTSKASESKESSKRRGRRKSRA